MPGGIEVVRADFKWLHPHTALLQHAQQAKRDGGFTTTTSGTCKDKGATACQTYLKILFRVERMCRYA
jgi:hypothetical protein